MLHVKNIIQDTFQMNAESDVQPVPNLLLQVTKIPSSDYKHGDGNRHCKRPVIMDMNKIL